MSDLEEFAKTRFEFNRQKQALKEQQEQRLQVTYNGGLFTVNTTLLSFLYAKAMNAGLLQMSKDTIILDDYDTPISVDVQELLVLCDKRYIEVMNDWQNEIEELKSKRRVKDVGV